MRRNRLARFRYFAAVCAAAMTLLMGPMVSQAAVVLQFEVSEMMGRAASVFHGRAISARSEWTPDHQSIVTHVTFEVLDALKGAAAGDTVTLTFTGGTVDGMSLSLSGLRIPSVGDEGVYFVESTTSGQDSPILGWNQGQFRVLKRGGVDRVYTADGQPVKGLDERVILKTLNEDHAAGVMLDENDNKALEVGAFKSRMLDMSGGVR